MDSSYIIRVLIEGRDNLSKALATATAKLKAFREEARLASKEASTAGDDIDRSMGQRAAAGAAKVTHAIRDVRQQVTGLKKDTTELTDAQNELTAARLKHDAATKTTFLAEERLAKLKKSDEASANAITRAEVALDRARAAEIGTARTLRELEEGLSAARGKETERLSDLEVAQNKLRIAQANHQNLLRSYPADSDRVVASQNRLENAFRNVEKAEAAAAAAGGKVETNLRSVRNESRRAAMATEDYKRFMHGLGVETESIATRFARMTRETNFWGNSLRGVQRSLFDTRRGVRDMDATMRRLQGSGFEAFYNMTRGADNAAKSFFRMNTIMSFLAPLLFTVVTAVLNLAAALVAVASAATMAAAALGGALLAGLMQLIPVVGLLVAAFHRLSLVMQASQMLTKGTADSHHSLTGAAKTHREAVERLADAQYGLGQQYQNVRDQAYNVKLAEQALTEARRQAARDLVDYQNARTDSILAERDAQLSLLEAEQRLRDMEIDRQKAKQSITEREAQVREAQQRLDTAKQQGDPAEIVAAEQGLALARQNLSGARNSQTDQDLEFKRARLEVTQAEQRLKEAIIERKRAIEDANRAERLGVNGAKAVVAAQHAIVEAIRAQQAAYHDLARAQREVRDAAFDVKHPAAGAEVGGQSNTYKDLLKRLDPTERELLGIVEKFRKLWNKATQPLTDSILKAIGQAIQQAETLLADSKFMASFQRLADTIGDQIIRLAKFFTNPEQKKFFERFTDLANKNLPAMVTIFERIFTLVEKIALAFAPVFAHILGGVNDFLGRQIGNADKRKTDLPDGRAGVRSNTNLENFAKNSETYLDSVSHFFGAVLRFLGAVIHVAAPSGKNALDDMADAFNGWAKALRGPKEAGAREFFERSITVAGLFIKLIGRLVDVLFEATQNQGFEDFLKVLSGPGADSLHDVAFVYGKIFSAIAQIAAAPGLGKVIEYLGALYLLSKVTPLGGIARFLSGKALGGLLGTGAPALNESALALTGAAVDLSAAATALEVAAGKQAVGGAVGGAAGAGGARGVARRGLGGIAKKGIPFLGIGGAEVGAEVGLGGALIAAAPVLAVVAAIAAAIAGLILLMKYTGHLGEAFKGVKQIVLPILDATFIKPFQIIKDLWTGDWASLWKHTTELFIDLFITPVKGAWHILHASMLSVYDGIRLGSKALFTWLGNHWEDALKGIAFVVGGPIGLAIVGSWRKIWNGMRSVYNQTKNFILRDIPGFISSLADKVGGAFASLGKALAAPINKIIDGWNKVVDFLHLDGWKADHIGGGGSDSSKGGRKNPSPEIINRDTGGLIHPVPGGVFRVAEAGKEEVVIPLDPKHKARAMALVAATQRSVEGGGSLAAFHGYGKPKTGFDVGGAIRGGVGGAVHAIGKVLSPVESLVGFGLDKLLGLATDKATAALMKLVPHPKLSGLELNELGNAIIGSILHAVRTAVPHAIAAAKGVASSLLGKGVGAAKKAFDVGGEIQGANGQPVPIMAHAGEWVLNKIQQSRLARAIGRNREYLTHLLFGTNPEGDGPGKKAKPGTGGRGKNQFSRDSYFGPELALSDVDGEGDFVQNPDKSEGLIGRKDALYLLRNHGYKLPADMLRSKHYQGVSKQVRDNWKWMNITREFVRQNIDPKLFKSKGAEIFKRMEYARGGVVRAWAPPVVGAPVTSFAAGGVVTTPATTGVRQPNHVNQQFEIHTESPNVDVDYVMRIAKIHAEASF